MSREVITIPKFEFKPSPRPDGKYKSMTDVKNTGDVFFATEVIDDDTNSYRGEIKPRFLVKGTLGDSDAELLVSVSKGYSRDDFLVALAAHLEEDDTPEPIRFVPTQGSAYIDIVQAEV